MEQEADILGFCIEQELNNEVLIHRKQLSGPGRKRYLRNYSLGH